ncbi:glioma pathogenesis-related protein 1-like [Tiliqua scincoides]|uniref:glioma pathogenesis-related protein 1-like n=1 Tax=Tiliqua scincoides TaxID=71010 RepID=UPI0034626FBB
MTEIHLLLGVLMFLDLSAWCCSYGLDTLPDIRNADFIKECVRAHNHFRSSVTPPASDMRRMSWDHDLAITAHTWAQKCHFQHNPDLQIRGKVHPIFPFIGENIWTGSGMRFNVTNSLKNWYDEVKDYNYATQQCHKVCGHYTQMVWATSYKVGCAVHFCPRVTNFRSPNAAHFICNYGPGGNYPTRPYKTGAACSECPGEPCVDRLCGEFLKDPSCDEYCILVLALRPSLALLTLAVATLVQKYYPTTFRYD